MNFKKPGKGDKDTFNEDFAEERTLYKSNITRTKEYVEEEEVYTYQSGYRENVYMEGGDNSFHRSLSPNQEARVIETQGNITTIKVSLPYKRDTERQNSPKEYGYVSFTEGNDKTRMSPNRNSYGSPLSPNSARVAKPVAADIIFRTIMKHRMDLMIEKIRRTPNLELRLSILKRLSKSKCLREEMRLLAALRLWKSNAFRIALLQDKKFSMIPKYLEKFSVGWQKKFLVKYFSLWARKSVIGGGSQDLLNYFRGFNFLHDYARKAVFKHTMPINSTKGIKNKLLTSLGLTHGKCRLLTLRNFLNKWKAFVTRCNEDGFRLSILKNLGGSIFRKFTSRVLMKYIQRWKGIIHWIDMNDKINSNDNLEKKSRSTDLLNSGLDRLAKRTALKHVMSPLGHYASDLDRQKAARAIVGMFPKLNKLLLRSWYNKWKDFLNKSQLKDARNSIFLSLAKGNFSRLRLKILGKYFAKWNRFTLGGGDKIGKFLNGFDLFRKFSLKRNLPDVVSAMTDSYNKKYTYNLLFKCLGFSDKFIKRHYVSFLLRWRRICYLMALRENGQSLSFKIMNTMGDKIKKRFLAKRFNQWKALLKVDVAALFERYRLIGDRMKRIFNKLLEVPKRKLLDGINKYKSNRTVNKALRIFANFAFQGQAYLLKLMLSKWRIQARKITNYDGILKIFRGSVLGRNNRTIKSDLARVFYRWRQAALGKQIVSQSKGLGILNELLRKRYVGFLSQLRSNTRIIKNVILADGRGNLIKALIRRFQLNNLGAYLKKWKLIKDDIKKKNQNKEIGNRKIGGKVQSLFSRADRDKTTKYFNKWRLKSKKPAGYFLLIHKFLEILSKNTRKATLRGPFYDILNCKNYKKLVLSMLGANNKLVLRLQDRAKARAFKKMRDNANKERINDYRNIIFGRLEGLFKNRSKGMLTRSFFKWRRIALNKYDSKNIIDGWTLLLNFARRQNKPDIVNASYENYWKNMKDKGLSRLFGLSKTYLNRKLHACLLKWARVNFVMKHQDLFSGKAMRGLKLQILKNWIWSPLEKSFNKWRRTAGEKVDKVKYGNGIGNLEKFVQTKHAPNLLKALNNTYWKKYQDELLLKLLPNRGKFLKNHMGQFLQRWRKNGNHSKVKGLQFKILDILFDKGKKKFLFSILLKYFRKWAYRKFPFDLTKVINGENVLFKFFCNKYMTGFFPVMNDYSKFKFLRSLLLKNSKFHRRNLDIFFDRWRKNADKIKNNDFKLGLIGRIMGGTVKFRLNKAFRDILARRFGLWKNYTNTMNKYGDKFGPFKKLLQVHALKSFLPAFNAFKLYLKKCGKLSRVGSIVLNTLMRRLFSAFMRWRNKLGLFNYNDVHNDMKQRVLKMLANRSPKLQLLRAFMLWRSIKEVPFRTAYYIMGVKTLKRAIWGENWPIFMKSAMERVKLHRFRLLFLRTVAKYGDHTKNAFLYWLEYMRDIRKNDKARIIQKFIRGPLYDRLDDAKKRRYVQIIGILSDIYLKILFRRLFDKLYNNNKKIGLNNIAKVLDNKRKNNLKNAKDALKRYGDDLHGNKNKNALLIQKMFRAYISRKGIWGLITRIRKLRFLLRLMLDRNLRFLHSAFKLWRNKCLASRLDNKARIIQRFLRNDILMSTRERTKYIVDLWKLLARRLWMSTGIGRLQLIKYFSRFNRFGDLMKKYYFKLLRDRVWEREKGRILAKMFKVPEHLRLKYLAYWFPKWADKTKKIIELSKREDDMKDMLFKIWGKYVGKFEDLRKFYLSLWLRNAKKLRMQNAGYVITKFVRDKWREILIKRIWFRWAYGLWLKAGKLSGFEILRRFRFYKGCERLNKLGSNLLKDSWELFKDRVRLFRVSKLIKLIWVHFEDRQNILRLRFAWRKWRHVVGKEHIRDKAADSLVDLLDKKRRWIAIYLTNAAFGIKKLLKLILLARLRLGFDSIKGKADRNGTIGGKVDILNKINDSLLNHNGSIFSKRLYKLYVYKILSKFLNYIDSYYNDHYKKKFFTFFFEELLDKWRDKSSYKDNKSADFKNKNKDNKTFKHSIKTQNPKKVQAQRITRQPEKYIAPHLVKLLEKFILKRKRNAFDDLSSRWKAMKFLLAFKNYCNKKNKGFFSQYLNGLNKYYYFLNGKPQYQDKLRLMFRRGFIRMLLGDLLKSRRLYRIFYLVKLALMHKNVAQGRYVKDILGKWRFVVLMRALTERKIGEFKKNVDNMFNDMFGGDEYLLTSEYEGVGNSLGFFKNEDKGFYDFLRRKHYISLKSNYKFDYGLIGLWYEEYKMEKLSTTVPTVQVQAKSYGARSGMKFKDNH